MSESKPSPQSSEPDDPPKESERFATLYQMFEDDPDLKEPLWPPVLLGLLITIVLVALILWRAGVFGWPWPFEGFI